MRSDVPLHPALRKLLAGLLLGAGAAAIVLAIAAGGLFETAELKLYDWRMRLAADPESVNKDIVLVEINDSTIPRHGADLRPLAVAARRAVVRHRLSRIARPRRSSRSTLILAERDRVEQYDIGGDKWSGKESDQALADAVKQSGNVIMLVDAVNEGLVGDEPGKEAPSVAKTPVIASGDRAEPRPVVLPPYSELAEASAGLGHNFLVLDKDGPARTHDAVHPARAASTCRRWASPPR